MRRLLALASFCLILLSRTLAIQAQVPWVETGYNGAALIDTTINQIEVDSKGNVAGVVASGPTFVYTTDQGSNWQFLSGPSSEITGLEFFNKRFYLSTRDQGLLQSTNLKDWQQVDIGGSTRIDGLDADKGVLIARLRKDTIKYLSASATSFVTIPMALTKSSGSLAMNGANELLYLSTEGYWRSEMGSTEWTRLSNGMSVFDITVTKDSLWIGTELGNGVPVLYASPLDRVVPDQLRVILTDGPFRFRKMYTTQDSVVIALREDKQTGVQELHYSINRQQLSPPRATAGFSNSFMNDFAIRDGRVYAAVNRAMYRSDNYFLDWSFLTGKLESNRAQHLLALPGGEIIATTSRGFVMMSTDQGNTWTTQSDLNKEATLLAYTPAGTLLVGVQGQLLASRDLGKTFLGTNEGFSDRRPQAFAVGRNEKLFLGTDSGIFNSTDDGASWFRMLDSNIFIVSETHILPEIYTIAVDTPNNRLYVGTNRGVLLSLDEGNKYESGWLAKSPIYALAVNRWGRVFAGSTSIVSSDANKRNFYRGWEVLTSDDTAWLGIDSSFVNDFDLDKIMLNSKGQLISGVLFSRDEGLTWTAEPIEGLGTPHSVQAQTIDANDIAYISLGDKIYKSGGPKVGVAKRERALTLNLGVYPNPAADHIQLKSGSGGEVTIFNALGEGVLKVDQYHSGTIDIRSLPTGNYICQLTSSAGISRVPLAVVR